MIREGKQIIGSLALSSADTAPPPPIAPRLRRRRRPASRLGQAQAAAYTYAMLVQDYTLSFCFWWTAVISIGVGTLPSFDTPEGARMKQLWGKGIPRALRAMCDLDCLAHITRLAATVPGGPADASSGAGPPRTR